MGVNKAYKYRLYPNKKQETLIATTIGSSRFVFNYFLDKWNRTYKSRNLLSVGVFVLLPLMVRCTYPAFIKKRRGACSTTNLEGED